MAAAEEHRASDAERAQREVLGLCLDKRRALIIVDVQRDFCEGGSLAVPDGNSVIEVTNALRERFNWDLIVLTQDWHPPDHISFSSNNPGTSVFETVDLPGVGPQVMWPDHCVQGSEGASFHPHLARPCTSLTVQAGDDVGDRPDPEGTDRGDVVVRKGTVREVDSYSGFGDASFGEKELTPMRALLESRGIGVLVVVGLAQDFCVSFTCRDGRRCGFDVVLVRDGTKGITEAGVASEMGQCESMGVRLCGLEDIPTRSLEAKVREEKGMPPWRRFGEMAAKASDMSDAATAATAAAEEEEEAAAVAES